MTIPHELLAIIVAFRDLDHERTELLGELFRRILDEVADLQARLQALERANWP